MAKQVYRFAVTTPAGTAQAVPLSTALTLPVRQVDEVRLRVPPGPAGALGVQLMVGGVVIIPYQAAQWIVTDNEEIPFPLDDYPESGSWSLRSYNTGSYDHTVWVTFLTSLVTGAPAVTPQPISAADLMPNVVLAR